MEQRPWEPLPVADDGGLQFTRVATDLTFLEAHEVGDGIVAQELLGRGILIDPRGYLGERRSGQGDEAAG